MRILSSALFFAAVCGPCAAFAAQVPGNPPQAASQAPSVQTASAILQPALDTLQQTIGMLHPEKWKASGAVRGEVGANISSIRQDLESMLPPLLATADGAPGSVARVLPAYRNIEALYDVLLRVAEAGRLSAPGEQASALEEARASLEAARRTLGESLESNAQAQERRLGDLQAALRAAASAPVVTPAACPPPPPPAKKRKRRPTPANKPATAPASPQGAASH